MKDMDIIIPLIPFCEFVWFKSSDRCKLAKQSISLKNSKWIIFQSTEKELDLLFILNVRELYPYEQRFRSFETELYKGM